MKILNQRIISLKRYSSITESDYFTKRDKALQGVTKLHNNVNAK
jgi:hypothetical protein